MGFYISPTYLKNGYYLLDYDKGYSKYLRNVESKFPLFHPFLIVRKENAKKAHLFGFCSKKPIDTLPSLYMNNLALFKSFTDYFLSTNKDTDALLNMANLRGNDLYYGHSFAEDKTQKFDRNSSFLKQIGINAFLLDAGKKLSRREREVLDACNRGKTAAQCGDELKLSPRTVQSYIENIKNKLGLSSREELLQTAKILEIAGIFDHE
jgi:DNA-binding CsgD family transcriptional regulator